MSNPVRHKEAFQASVTLLGMAPFLDTRATVKLIARRHEVTV